jgi:haloalkane dehalogenase
MEPQESKLALRTTLPSWAKSELYPFTPATTLIEGQPISYIDEGEGDPVLFVHGTPSWSFEWRHVIQRWSGSFRCIAPDHLGFGLSAKPQEGPYRPEDHARRLHKLVAKLGLRDVTLVVHDFGVPIGLSLALEEPERFRALVISNGWFWPLQDDRKLVWTSRLVRSALGRFLYTRLNASPRWLIPSSFYDRTKLRPEVHEHYLAPFASPEEREAPWALGCSLTGSHDWYRSLWERRERISQLPAHIIWGAQDPAFGAPYLARVKSVFEHSVVSEMEAGHFPQEELPGRFADLVGAALQPIHH